VIRKSIAFIGQMGSGKTALAKRFADEFGARKIALGDPLKADVLKYGLVPGNEINKATDRHILQSYGQLRRGEVVAFNYYDGMVSIVEDVAYQGWNSKNGVNIIGPCYLNYWVDQFINNLSWQDIRIPIINTHVNDDIRRLNEVVAIKNIGFKIIKVNVDDDVRLARLTARDGSFDPATLNDISESEIPSLPYDVAIDNNATFEEAWDSLLKVI
jgi:dephospho-CoA kinase